VPISLRLLLKGQMRFMKEQGFDVIMISADGKEAEVLEELEGCEMITLPMERSVSPLNDLRSLSRLIRIFRNIRPDIVHSHTPKAGLLGMLAAWITRVPVRLHTVAGLPWIGYQGFSYALLRKMEQLTAACALRVYPNSSGLYDFLDHQRVAKVSKMKLLGRGSSNGIDCTYFSRSAIPQSDIEKLRQQVNVTREGWVWIFVGRLVREKGLCELFGAFDRLFQFFPQDQLWLVGEEEVERDPLPKDAVSWMISHPGVKRFGFREDVRPYFAAADVLVFPSYREGFPNVPLQAGAMECAMILSDINGCNELVKHRENGLLVPPQNEEALFQTMQQLRENAAWRKEMAGYNRKMIVENYSQETIWKLMLAEYRYFLEKKSIRYEHA
jgi:glycosyltransferase involved in cell wall biosynthesis